MDDREAADLIADGVGESEGSWADFGAGTGTSTREVGSRPALGPENHSGGPRIVATYKYGFNNTPTNKPAPAAMSTERNG